LSYHRIADFNFAPSIRAWLISPKPNQSGVNSKKPKKWRLVWRLNPPIGILEIISYCFPLYRLLQHFKPSDWNIFWKINNLTLDLPTKIID
jgi:hypothetical protein